MGGIVISLSFYKEDFDIKLDPKFGLPLKKETKLNRPEYYCVYKFMELDRNTWSHLNNCGLFIIGRETKKYTSKNNGSFV